MAKLGIVTHPKTLRLANRLQVPAYAAVGLLECLWHWCYQYAITGEIKHEFEDVAIGIGWTGSSSDDLFRALLSCRWLDQSVNGSYGIHDLGDHAPTHWRGTLKRRNLEFWQPEVVTNGATTEQSMVQPEVVTNGATTEQSMVQPEVVTNGATYLNRIPIQNQDQNPDREIPADYNFVGDPENRPVIPERDIGSSNLGGGGEFVDHVDSEPDELAVDSDFSEPVEELFGKITKRMARQKIGFERGPDAETERIRREQIARLNGGAA